jgi:DNA-binding response OmpR family regulator
MRVLVAEDESRLAEAVARGLRREGMAVDVAGDGHTALTKAMVHDYDVVVLDRDLPVMHGDEVCRRLADESRPGTKVLMLTAAAGVEDLVDGLSLGADDYMGKPFDFAELVARVRALGRRNGVPRPPLLRSGDVVLDPARREVRRGERFIDLAPKEFGVLETLLAAEGAAVSSEELLARVWDEHADPFTHTVRTTVMTLRRKLGDPQIVLTVPGAGYRV